MNCRRSSRAVLGVVLALSVTMVAVGYLVAR